MAKAQFHILTLFPAMCEAFLKEGVVGQALKKGLLDCQLINPRDFAHDGHRRVDDRPFGGGDGMVMLVEPLALALNSIPQEKRGRVVLLSPQGRSWNDSLARQWAAEGQPLTLICGRYAGVDERFRQKYVDAEISVGDFVLSGGELGALAILDSLARLTPGVLGNEESPQNESFSDGLLECPQFTRPRDYEGLSVPEALLSGHHEAIARFRRDVSLLRTKSRRPDLITASFKEELPPAAARLCGLSVAELASLDLDLKDLQKWSRGEGL